MKTWKKALSLTAAVAMTATMMPVSAFAADDETFKIGVIGPMTGDNAQYGLGVYHAAQVAAEEINANGGFNGYNVEILDAGDDQADPEKAVNAYNDLLDKGMQMLCGTVTSGSCIAVGAGILHAAPQERRIHSCLRFYSFFGFRTRILTSTQIAFAI